MVTRPSRHRPHAPWPTGNRPLTGHLAASLFGASTSLRLKPFRSMPDVQRRPQEKWTAGERPVALNRADKAPAITSQGDERRSRKYPDATRCNYRVPTRSASKLPSVTRIGLNVDGCVPLTRAIKW